MQETTKEIGKFLDYDNNDDDKNTAFDNEDGVSARICVPAYFPHDGDDHMIIRLRMIIMRMIIMIMMTTMI